MTQDKMTKDTPAPNEMPDEPKLPQVNDVINLLGHSWKVYGIHLGAVGVESLIELESLTHRSGWTGEWESHPRVFVPEVFVRHAMNTPANLRAPVAAGGETFQARVKPWMDACFGPEISADKIERNHRFLEEALELVQANGCTQSEAHQLVDYVYGRDVGEINQEVGGVMVTLAALCLANGIDMHEGGETELARIWTKVEKIRAKQAAKPKHSPLPQHVPALQQPPAPAVDVEVLIRDTALVAQNIDDGSGPHKQDVEWVIRHLAAQGMIKGRG